MTACPTDDQLVRMIEGTLVHDSVGAIELHVDRCEQCAAVVGGLGAFTVRSRAGTAPPDHPELAHIDPEHYALGDELARGGMGRILRARDRRLGRDIAIKMNFVSTGEHRRRFEREARIMARLQHPSIVHIHEAGIWPTGEPFLAMQLVSGRSLDEVIGDATSLGERLALIPNALAVADAVAFAHNQGVLHRDLKPRNVLLGEFGETVVIDWGLAKDLEADGPDAMDGLALGSPDRTEVGQVVGTPAYMPPEQAQGKPVDRSADVYALGAVLFHILAGRPPVSGRTSEEVLAKLIAGPSPSLADRGDFPPDLLAIVDKAMAFEPADRYPSARELADDLRKFQTGQLVGAHRYSLPQLVRRWLRRHRAAVFIAAAAVLVLASVGIISVRRVVEAEQVAQTQRQAAELRRTDADELMLFMLNDLRQRLEPLGRLDLLELVAHKATAYYAKRSDTVTFTQARARAVALENLGTVLLAQGHTADALATFRTALGISEALAVQHPGDPRTQRDLAVKHERISDVLVKQDDVEGAQAELHASFAITERLLADDPNNDQLRRDLGVDHERLGDFLDLRGQSAEALVEYRASLALDEEIAAHDRTPTSDRDVSSGHERIGSVLQARGESAAALVEYRAALALHEQLVAREPTNAVWQRDLASIHAEIGVAMQDDLAGALAEYRAATKIGAALVERDPDNRDLQSELAINRSLIAKTLLALGDAGAAIAELRPVLAILDKLAADNPSRVDVQQEREGGYLKLGDARLAQRDTKSAFAAYRTGLEIARALAARDPTNLTWQRDLARLDEKLAFAHEQEGDTAAALGEHRDCLAIRVMLGARDPGNVQWQTDVAASHFNIGELLAKTDLPGAIAEQRLALQISERLVAHEPANLAAQRDVVESHTTIAGLLAHGDPGGARAELQDALAIVEQLAAANPSDPTWVHDAAELRRKLGR